MARVIFTDFSGIKEIGASQKVTRTSFFVETPGFLENGKTELPWTNAAVNGLPISFATSFTQSVGGWQAEADINTDDHQLGASFAKFYLNLMLDVTALKFALPFQVLQPNSSHSAGGLGVKESSNTSAVINDEDLEQSTRLSLLLFTQEPVLLRAIGWYRRGLSSPDQLLRFLGLYNSLEIAASHYSVKNEKTRLGTMNQIYQLISDTLPNSGVAYFKADTDELGSWLKENTQMRVDIAHGLGTTEFDTSEKSKKLLPKLKHIATDLLRALTDLQLKSNLHIVALVKQADCIRSHCEEMEKQSPTSS